MTHIYRAGDLVCLTGKVRHNLRPEEDAFVFVDVDGHHTALMIKPENLTLIAPRIDVGERVRWTNGLTGTVKAADGDKIWVLHDTMREYVTWPAREVTIIPPAAADGGPYIPPLAGSLDDDAYETPPVAPLDGEDRSGESA